MRLFHSCVLVLWTLALIALVCPQPVGAQTNWPQWRGPSGEGHVYESMPVEWSAADVVWKTPLPGRGQSSPVIWGERIFLSSASEDGTERSVFCVDRGQGKLLWQKVVGRTDEPEKLHKMNSYASATCATDGEHVVAFFGRGGLHCLNLEGELLWSRELGPFAGPWGTGASPIIVDDLVIQNCDAEDEAYLLAVDKRTGETRWKTPRDKVRGWSTPIVVQVNGGRELVLNGEAGVNAYDVETGSHLWFSKGDSGRGEPTVVRYNDLLIAMSGRPGDMWATRLGGRGTVNGSHEVWRTKRASGRDLPSPVVVGNYLVVPKLQPGIVHCYDALTGEQLSQVRLDGNVPASLIAANGLVYVLTEAGVTHVLRPGNELEVVARNTLEPADEEIFRASLAVADGQIFCRSDRVLYCIGKRK